MTNVVLYPKVRPAEVRDGRALGRRRIITALLGIALVRPTTSGAQSRPLVAVLRVGAWSPVDLKDKFVEGLRDLGLQEHRDINIAYRLTEGQPAREPDLIAEMVGMNPAVIVAQTTGLVVGVKKVTDTIPIVAVSISDPVEIGLAQSLAHPGGNVTGFTSRTAQTSKQLEILLQIVPKVKTVGVLINPSNAAHERAGPRFMADVGRLPVAFVWGEARTPGEIEAAIGALARDGADVMHVAQDAMFNQEMQRIADLALAARLPTTYGFRQLPDAGGLMSYGNNLADRWRRVGWYVAKIVKGEKPGDLPIEQGDKLELVINLRTAKVLGLTIPPLVLTRADEVIE